MDVARLSRIGLCVCAVSVGAIATASGQQVVDRDFDTSVARPAYQKGGPTVAIDEAHGNFHTAGGQYQPFADLLTNDGYRVIASTRKFEPGALDGIDILVIANANAGNLTDPAFTEAECDVVRDWVNRGGALLLIADHAPFGASAANLGARFGVSMGKGWVFEPTATGLTTQLTFSRDNGRLGEHPTLQGRDPSEAVKVVRTFTGQSLGVPEGATALLRLSSDAREAPTTKELDAEAAARRADKPVGEPGAQSVAVGSRAQGLALTAGKGRIVVLGEAAMFSAQVVTLKDGDRSVTFKAGMNAAGNDDRQFALNVLHWLSRLLP